MQNIFTRDADCRANGPGGQAVTHDGADAGVTDQMNMMGHVTVDFTLTGKASYDNLPLRRLLFQKRLLGTVQERLSSLTASSSRSQTGKSAREEAKIIALKKKIRPSIELRRMARNLTTAVDAAAPRILRLTHT